MLAQFTRITASELFNISLSSGELNLSGPKSEFSPTSLIIILESFKSMQLWISSDVVYPGFPYDKCNFTLGKSLKKYFKFI